MNWKQDLEQLAEDLPKFHLNLFDFMTRQEFQAGIERLKREENNLDSYSMVMEISKLIAQAGDAHTALEIPKNNMLPFTCFWFEEGICITDGASDGKDFFGFKILEMEGIPVSEIIEELTQVIAHENLQFVRSQLPAHLMCTDILYGLGFAKSVEEVEMTLEDQDGSKRTITVHCIKNKEWENISTKRNKHYWLEKMEEENILFVHYDRCQEMEDYPMEKFILSIKQTLEQEGKFDTLVLDYRYNKGGNSELFRPFIEWLGGFEKSHPSIKIVVLVGRDTFSSALLNVFLLKNSTSATFVGEPTGGKPNCYGEVQYFQLRNSGLSVRYSTKYYYLLDDYQVDSFYPEVHLPVRFSDYREEKDPCLEWIIESRKGTGEG